MLSLYRRALGMFRSDQLPPIVKSVRKASLTYLSEAALKELYDVVRDAERRGGEGMLIEAGCALGGSAIVMAAAKSPGRPLYVYDVFGMIPEPSSHDGEDVHRRYAMIKEGRSSGIGGNRYYGYEHDLFDLVVDHFRQLELPVSQNNVHLVKGLFQDTLDVDAPVAVAHLDGDWYESVMVCLRRIEPNLVRHGVLVIDDYDSWSGCRRAVDEYFADKSDLYTFLHRSRLHIVRR